MPYQSYMTTCKASAAVYKGKQAVATPGDSVSTYENVDLKLPPTTDETEENSSDYNDFVIN